jgi:hypothetical protein
MPLLRLLPQVQTRDGYRGEYLLYYFSYCLSLIWTQVYNDAATFRSRIKQVVLAVVPLEYGLALFQENTIASVKTKASGLLKKTNFLRGDRDAEVCFNYYPRHSTPNNSTGSHIEFCQQRTPHRLSQGILR